MRKGIVAVWALLTFGFSWAAFAIAMPLHNRESNLGNVGRANNYLMGALLVQVIWLGAGWGYARISKNREAVPGIVLGFGLEALALFILILVAASAHY